MAVARVLKDKYPGKAVLIAGDDDRHLLNHPQLRANPGREKTEKAAQAVGAKPSSLASLPESGKRIWPVLRTSVILPERAGWVWRR